MKTIPLIFLAVACLALGWFTHYTLVPETEVKIDTLTVYDTTYVLELQGKNFVVVKSCIGWTDISIDDTATIGKVVWETTEGDTIESFHYKNGVILSRMMKVNKALSK